MPVKLVIRGITASAMLQQVYLICETLFLKFAYYFLRFFFYLYKWKVSVHNILHSLLDIRNILLSQFFIRIDQSAVNSL